MAASNSNVRVIARLEAENLVKIEVVEPEEPQPGPSSIANTLKRQSGIFTNTGAKDFPHLANKRHLPDYAKMKAPLVDIEWPQKEEVPAFDELEVDVTSADDVFMGIHSAGLEKVEKLPQESEFFAASLNTPSSSLKNIYVTCQNRYVIDKKLGNVTSVSGKTVTYSILPENEKDDRMKKLKLRGIWSTHDWLRTGDLVNIVGVAEDENRSFELDTGFGFLVLEPDRLIAPTSILSMMYCERKAALTSRFYMGGGDNIHMFRGTLAHELIGQAMKTGTDKKPELLKLCQKIGQKTEMLEKAYGIGLTDEAYVKMQEEIVVWVEKFMNRRFRSVPKDQAFTFLSVLALEENVWNPIFGLKGRIDATVSVLLHNISVTSSGIIPLEFKTRTSKGRYNPATAEHVGQVALYKLMMSTRYSTLEATSLYYINDDYLHAQDVQFHELQHLISMRNNYIYYSTMTRGLLLQVPSATADFDFKCTRCEVKNLCTLDVTKTTYTGLRNNTEARLAETATLSEVENDFLSTWINVIHSETEMVELKFNDKGIWTSLPREREAAGTCVADLKMTGSLNEFKGSSGSRGYLMCFVKQAVGKRKSDIPYTFSVDDFVVISTNVEPCISHGTVMVIRGNEITVSVDQELNDAYSKADFTFCLDKVNYSSPISSQYGYLMNLMKDTEEAKRLREYLVMLKQPKFGKIPIPEAPVKKILEELNNDQKRVITKAMATDSFLFVKGCPGSGKTTTIVCLIRALVATGKSVLVVSYTGSALENIFLKYKRYSRNFLKISTSRKSKDDLMTYTTKERAKKCKTIKSLTNVYKEPVIGTTLLSLKHPIFQVRRFDYLIVDEASQALPTSVFGALLLAQKYVVFGDPDQLPPVLQSETARNMDHDNFFSMMATPLSTVKLNIQYRMNKTIMDLANGMVYENQMKCGDIEQENACLKLAQDVARLFLLEKVKYIPTRKVMVRAVSRKLEKAVVFFDTSELKGIYETRTEDMVSNEAEKMITLAFTAFLAESKVALDDIGIITPFRGQVEAIKRGFKKFGARFERVEVSTVDQYQGREKNAIICSFTRCQKPFQPPENQRTITYRKTGIMDDIRRLNVALTRAREKVIMIGNKTTLMQYQPFQKMFSVLTESQQWKLTAEELDGIMNCVELCNNGGLSLL